MKRCGSVIYSALTLSTSSWMKRALRKAKVNKKKIQIECSSGFASTRFFEHQKEVVVDRSTPQFVVQISNLRSSLRTRKSSAMTNSHRLIARMNESSRVQ